MSSFEVNGPNVVQSSTSSTVKLNQQDKQVYASIYNMLQSAESDKNNNWILDAKDFKDSELLSFAKSKGLVGKSWNAAIDYVKGIINGKKEQVIEINKDVLNERTGEHYDSAVQNGREISRTYYKIDEDGNKVIDEIINLEYDENDRIQRKIYMDANGNVKDSVIVSPEDETKVLTRTEYDEMGQWTKIGTYDEKGELVKVVGIKREVDEYGQKRFTQETYTKAGDKWNLQTESGFDDVKVTYGKPYLSY